MERRFIDSQQSLLIVIGKEVSLHFRKGCFSFFKGKLSDLEHDNCEILVGLSNFTLRILSDYQVSSHPQENRCN